MSPVMAISKILVLFLALEFVRAEVKCNSSAPGQEDGTCTGDYCFNVDDQLRGCVNFYRQIRDDNIACGDMHLMGKKRRTCVCTQAYCGKYDVANMPQQTLAQVDCTDNYSESGYCRPGPCYVGNDLPSFNETVHPQGPQQTCMPDWFAMTNFQQLIFYEVPPLANHSACFFSDDKFNCYCKDPGCNSEPKPPLPAVNETDTKYYTCHKMSCQKNETCAEDFLGNDTCVGQMCYFLKNRYEFELDGWKFNETNYVRGCMNYSHQDPLGDLSFATGFEFGKSKSVFVPCYGNYCNGAGNSTTPTPPSGTATVIPSLLAFFGATLLIFYL